MSNSLLEPRLRERLTAKKQRLDSLRPLPQAAVHRLQEQILTEWIYHSNALEGNTISLQETRLILETGLTIGGKSLREHFEVINHRDAIHYVEQLVQQPEEPITPFHVRQIHRLVLSRIDDDWAGKYRQGQVRIAGAVHIPPEAWQVPQAMDAWSEWLNASHHLHPIDLAAEAHHRLAAIHPFVDGNGRTARLVMNLLLMRQGYPPAVILRSNRQQYYRVLASADSGRRAPLVNFIGRAAERSLTLYLEACEPQTTPPPEAEQWIPLREAAQGSPYTQEYLSLLARLGRIEAIKRGKTWYTTRRAIEAYAESTRSPR